MYVEFNYALKTIHTMHLNSEKLKNYTKLSFKNCANTSISNIYEDSLDCVYIEILIVYVNLFCSFFVCFFNYFYLLAIYPRWNVVMLLARLALRVICLCFICSNRLATLELDVHVVYKLFTNIRSRCLFCFEFVCTIKWGLNEINAHCTLSV